MDAVLREALKLALLELAVHLHQKILDMKNEEMESNTHCSVRIVMMEILLAAMAVVAHVQQNQNGFDSEDHRQAEIYVLKSVAMVLESTHCRHTETMQTILMAMDEAVLEELKLAGSELEGAQLLKIYALKFEAMELDLTQSRLIVMIKIQTVATVEVRLEL